MPITSSTVTDLSPHSGAFRARFSYTVTDGRVFRRGPIRVADSATADAKLLALEPDVLSQVQEVDADEAVDLDSKLANGEASKPQVEASWLRRGYRDRQVWRAYNKMNKVYPDLVALGLTIPGYANRLNITSARWLDYVAFMDYCNQGQNDTRIGWYQTIQQGDVREDNA